MGGVCPCQGGAGPEHGLWLLPVALCAQISGGSLCALPRWNRQWLLYWYSPGKHANLLATECRLLAGVPYAAVPGFVTRSQAVISSPCQAVASLVPAWQLTE